MTIHPLAVRAWPTLAGLALPPGAVVVGLGGEVLRLRPDGGADEVSAVPRRWSVSADPCAVAEGMRPAARGALYAPRSCVVSRPSARGDRP
jgi:hypothetical protein